MHINYRTTSVLECSVDASVLHLGPREDFKLNIHGKNYTIEDTIDDCEQSGGEMMIINYEKV